MKLICRIYILILAIVLTNCKKLVDIGAPVTSLNGSNVYANDATASAVLTGLYTNMSKSGFSFTGNGSISMNLGLSADEFTLFSGVSTSDTKYYYYTNSLFIQPSKSAGTDYWSPLYQDIFVCNAAIEGLNSSNSLTPAVKQQLLGEATFMRAFFYSYLVNLYGDLPLITNTDYKTNSTFTRSPKSDVFKQIIKDLKDAQELLSEKFVDASIVTASAERTRPNKWAAAALLARIYLYTGDWANAKVQADLVINNSTLFSLTNLNAVFLKNSTEAIWQLQPVSSQRNTEDAWMFIIPSSGPDASKYPVYLSPQLLSSFESLDQRLTSWINSKTINSKTYFFPYKYKSATSNAPLTEYLMVFRLAEQYLIRAEAEVQLGNIASGQNDLNIIRNRAGLSNTSANDKLSLLSSILHERQVELFTEWGHRWLDLKRTATIDAVMTSVCPQKNNSLWKSYQQLFPLPLKDINADVNLVQNPGY